MRAVPHASPADGPGDDRRLVLLARRGDPEALDRIVVEHHPRLRRYLRALFGPARVHETEEVLQETWLRALRGFARGAEVERLAPWLLTLARRAAIDRLRRRDGHGIEPLADAELVHESVPEPWPEGLDAADVDAALARLGAAERELITLHHLEGTPVHDVARILGIPEGTVKSRLHRARRLLRAELPTLP